MRSALVKAGHLPYYARHLLQNNVNYFQSVTCCTHDLFPVSTNDVIRKTYSKAIPVTGRGGLQGCGTSKISYFLDNRLTYGDEVVSPPRRPRFARKNNFLVLISVRALVNPRATVRPEGLGKLKIRRLCNIS
jgi:hypothetical protein